MSKDMSLLNVCDRVTLQFDTTSQTFRDLVMSYNNILHFTISK